MLDFLIDHWILTTIVSVYSGGFIFAKIIGMNWVVTTLWPIFLLLAKLNFINVQ